MLQVQDSWNREVRVKFREITAESGGFLSLKCNFSFIRPNMLKVGISIFIAENENKPHLICAYGSFDTKSQLAMSTMLHSL
jgi:hypothetical protein